MSAWHSLLLQKTTQAVSVPLDKMRPQTTHFPPQGALPGVPTCLLLRSPEPPDAHPSLMCFK